MIYIRDCELTGPDDYSVGDWDETKKEAVEKVLSRLDRVPDDLKESVRTLLAEDWKEGVELYNKSNWFGEFIEFYEV